MQFLEGFRSVKGVKLLLKSIHKIWPDYKQLILHKPRKDILPRVIEMNDKLLALSHQIVLDLQAKSGKKLAKVINTSGR